MAKNVVFKVDADMGKAIQGFLTLAQAQEKSGAQFQKSVAKVSAFEKSLGKVRSQMAGLAGGMIGGAGVIGGINAIVQGFQKSAEATKKFEGELTELLSLGKNLDNIKGIKESVLSMSGAWGIASGDITNAMFDIQSGGSALSDSIRDGLLKNSLLATKTMGGDLQTNVKGLLKTFLIYEDELKGVTDAQNKLALAADKGYMNMSELADLFPDVAAAAKPLGISINEVLASLVIATQVGGKNEKTFTGIRNTFLNLGKALEGGLIPATGTFQEKMAALSKVEPNLINKIFGNEAIGAVNALAGDSQRLLSMIQELEKTAGNSNLERYYKRMGDLTYQWSENMKSLQMINENMSKDPSLAGGKGGQFAESLAAKELGAKAAAKSTSEVTAALGESDWYNRAVGWTSDLKRGGMKAMFGAANFASEKMGVDPSRIAAAKKDQQRRLGEMDAKKTGQMILEGELAAAGKDALGLSLDSPKLAETRAAFFGQSKASAPATSPRGPFVGPVDNRPRSRRASDREMFEAEQARKGGFADAIGEGHMFDRVTRGGKKGLTKRREGAGMIININQANFASPAAAYSQMAQMSAATPRQG